MKIKSLQFHLIDFAAILVVLVTPFIKFVAYRDYGFLHPEVGVLLLGHLIFALALWGIASIRRHILLPLVLGLLISYVIGTEIELAAPDIIADWDPTILSIVNSKIVIMCLFTIAILFLCFVFRIHISKITLAGFATMLVAIFVIPLPQNDFVNARTTASSERKSDLPPIVHLILDQQIGPDGVPEGVEGGHQVRRSMVQFFSDRGFRIYPKAFTHFAATLESIPDIMNGAVTPSARKYLYQKDGHTILANNAWLGYLDKKNYNIKVIQSIYLDFCKPKTFRISYCITYNPADTRIIHEFDLTILDKSGWLFSYFLSVDHEILTKILNLSLYNLNKFLIASGIEISIPDVRELSLSPVATYKLRNLMKDHLRTLKPGEVLFAHLLLPHHPYLFEADCAIKPDISNWYHREHTLWWRGLKLSSKEYKLRYKAYFKQIGCTLKLLDEWLVALKKSGTLDSAIVIVHGDHGSLISASEVYSEFAAQISDRDIIDSYSTLFAIKAPGLNGGLAKETRSVQSLFAELAMGRNEIEIHQDIFLRPDDGTVGPNQLRRPMVPIGPSDESSALHPTPENGTP